MRKPDTTTIRLHGETDHQEQWLTIAGDLVEWEGKFYSDWEVFIVPDHQET